MNRFQRSWFLFKSSFAVIAIHRRLLLFPVLTAACTITILLLFLVPVTLQPTGNSYTSAKHWDTVFNQFYKTKSIEDGRTGNAANLVNGSRHSNIESVRPLGLAFFAAIYLVSMFCATYLNVAFYHEILKALKGEQVSIRAGIQFASTKWKSILLWTLFAGAVGMIIRTLEERFGLFGRIVLKLLGIAWSVACVFVIPILVMEEQTNPFSILKQSALTLKKTWGESLIGYAGVSFGSSIILFFSLFWLAGGVVFSIYFQIYWLIALVFGLWILSMVALSFLMGTANQIFRCALYLYATEGTLPSPFSQDMVEMAWKVKKSKA